MNARDLWNALSGATPRHRCATCNGTGIVIDEAVVRFVRDNGLPAYHVSETLLANEPSYGPLGSIPVHAWTGAGLSESAAETYFDEVAHAPAVVACTDCKVESNGEDVLEKAMRIISSLRGGGDGGVDLNAMPDAQIAMVAQTLANRRWRELRSLVAAEMDGDADGMAFFRARMDMLSPAIEMFNAAARKRGVPLPVDNPVERSGVVPALLDERESNRNRPPTHLIFDEDLSLGQGGAP